MNSGCPGPVAITHVVVVVCDIRGFSRMCERLAEDDVAAVLADWFQQCELLVERYGGKVDQFVGDAVLAYWDEGTDVLETGAAVLAAVRGILDAATRQIWPGQSEPFEIAVALHRGRVCVGMLGLGHVARPNPTILGDTVNTAFRIQSLMKSLGQCLTMSHEFWLIIAVDGSAYHYLGVHALKGKLRTVRLYGLHPAPSEPAA